ncbi:pyruvate decarboxylase [Cystobasidium minutum MCA 4210]|uniref:pyruvate decarboxylase n=1 Tax=Cystobasidium minutum MCA 4210 TaxID=1397322 RepID=UPI0034CE6C36|eukprot:jgi/Rhomi1/167450/fgenesh1_kg.2_\
MGIQVIDYILARLEQLGVTRIFGVPGDFTLVALDSVEDHPKIQWVGCANELGASYAADGYARVSRNLGVLFTTFGVGELSAANGVAGAFSERVPVLHIVGVPSTGFQSKKALLHHTLGDGRYDAYINVYKQLTIAQANLNKGNFRAGSSEASEEIDRVIRTALTRCFPTYLTLPTDLANAEISDEPLKTPITLDSIHKSLHEPKVDAKVEQSIIKQICQMYEKATKPIVLVDACAIRYGVQDYTRDLIERTGMTFFTSPMGKTAIDEQHPQFGGIYVGELTKPEVREAVESADFTLYVGALKSDFNTGSFSWHITPEDTVELHSDHTQIQYAMYPDAGFQSILPKLIPEMAKVARTKSSSQKVAIPKNAGLSLPPSGPASDDPLSQDTFWSMWTNFFKAGDVVLADTGTSNFGILDVRFPSKTELVTQILYGSIGWACGALLGASLAAQEQNRRTICFEGDGSLQLTVQEISTMLRQGATPILVILNNDGYVIERQIHGKERSYNDIGSWDHMQLLSVLNKKGVPNKSYRVSTNKELLALFNDNEFARADKMQLVEVMLGRQDAPRALREQAAMTEKANAQLQ